MKINLALLFGGNSVEHEVSVISALQAAANLDREKYNVIPVYIAKNSVMYTGKNAGNIEAYADIPALLKTCEAVTFARMDGKVYLFGLKRRSFTKNIITAVDVALPVVHGVNVEDGTIEGYLRMLDLPFAGSDILGSAVGMDKYVQKLILRQAGIPVLPALRLRAGDFASHKDQVIGDIASGINYPVIIKPVNLGSSVGIKIAKDETELTAALEYAFMFSNDVIAERAVMNLREINCAVLGDDDGAIPSECEEPIGSDAILSYNDKYASGGNGGKTGGSKGMASLGRIIPANIPEDLRSRIRDLSVKAFHALSLSGVTRVDFLLDAKTMDLWLGEVNTVPGSLAFYLFEPTGLKYRDLLERLIQLAFKRERERQSVKYSFESNILKSAKFSSGNKR
jgi:D-alanine-D-alanine ligase